MASLKRARYAPTTNPYASEPGPVLETDSNHAELIKHTGLFKKTLYSVEGVHCYVGWNMANIIIIETDTKLVVVDTGEDLKQMEEVWREFKENSTSIDESVRNREVIAIILTHHHGDHCQGTKYLKDLFPNAEIWGADNLDAEYQQENGLINPIMACRAMAQYNFLLHEAFPDSLEMRGMNSGIGPIITQSVVGYIKPGDKTMFSTINPYTIQPHTFDGVDFQVVYVPSEAKSEIAFYIPSRRVLISAEVIQDHSFPNIYSLRGANFRDPLFWSNSIDCFINNFAGAQHMVLQHGPPIIHNQPNKDPSDPTSFVIVEMLTRYRDAIQLVRDQTLRWAMKGYAKEEIMHLVNLPTEQQNYKPWLQPFYGTVKHSIPAVYTGYIGWFDGDPVALSPVPRSIMSAMLVQEMGGGQVVLDKAATAFKKGVELCTKKETLEQGKLHLQYAAELATFVIRERPYLNETKNPGKVSLPTQPHAHSHGPAKHLLHADPNEEGDAVWWNARLLKAQCFRQLAYREICANWYGTYLTAATELEGTSLMGLVYDKFRESGIVTAGSQDIPSSIDELGIRLKAEQAENVNAIINLQVTDAKSPNASIYRLHIRNCILAKSTPATTEERSIVVAGTTAAINLLLAGDVEGGFNAIIDSDKVRITPEGSKDSVKTFFAHFEVGKYVNLPNIYVH